MNNELVRNALLSMSPETQEEYKKFGEYFYNSTDFEKNKSNLILPEKEQLLIRADTSLKSGLDPKDLNESELQILYDTYGEKWYERYDLKENEVRKPIITVVNKPHKTVEDKKRIRKFEKKIKRKLRR